LAGASIYAIGALGLAVAIAWGIFYRRPASAHWLSETERRLVMDGQDAPKNSSRGAPVARGAALRRLLASPTMWALALTQGCAGYTLYLFMTWLPSYLAATRGLNVFSSGLYSAVPYAAATVLGIVLGWVSDRLVRRRAGQPGERRKLISGVLLLSSVILLAPFVSSIWVILLLIGVSLACVSTAMAMNIALTNDLLRDGGSAGTAVSLLILGGNVFGIMAPIVTGYLVSATSGFTGALLIAGTLLVIGAAVSFTLTRRPIDDAPSPHAAFAPGL
jgi:MFS family permease